MKINKKLIRDAFVEIFVQMFNNNANSMQLTFDFNKCVAKFEVNLVDVEEKKELGENK